jgi:mycothiol synthase
MMIIRAAGPEDMAGIQRICETALDLEPDAGALPETLTRDSDYLGLVAEDGGDVVGVCFGSPGRIAVDGPRRGHVDLLAVGGDARGRGTGMRLLAEMESLLREKGAAIALLAGNPPVYAWPGIDARYTVMTCLAGRAGYEKYRDAVDMAVSLRGADLDTGAAEERLGAAGIEVRRVAATEAGLVVGWLRQGPWGASGWPDEVASALARENVAREASAGQAWTAGCHVACRDDRYVGFASYGAMRRGWFGPMGTDAAERQHGIGTVLLKRCLADLAAAGLDTARIGWVGPVSFYARALGARVERVYWLYRKALLSTCPSMVACSPGSTARSRPTGSAAGWIADWRACCCSRATSPVRTS